MNKRLRKKLHKGEFQELGFEVTFNLNEPRESIDQWFNNWITFIESISLECGGGGGFNGEHEYFITKYKNSCVEDDRDKVLNWLTAKSNISNVKVKLLRDAWHGW